MLEQEVKALAVILVLHANALFLSFMLENQLLEPEERALVGDFLTDLNLRLPQMGRVRLLAVVALEVLNDELDDQVLLEHGVGHHLLLDG